MLFDWFKPRDYSHIGKFTDPLVYTYPLDMPKTEVMEKEPVTFYSVGPTDDNRVNLKVGHSSITMNKTGVQALIDLLQVSIDHLADDEADENE